MKISWWLIPFALGALSCSSAPRPVSVSGTPVDIQSLAGEWSGEYHADGGGRQGTVVFKLAAGADSATGDVLMFPRALPSAEETTVRQPLPQSLAIRFVRADHGKVNGVLSPYIDPDCQCRADTVFEGKLSGDTIEGTYNVARSGGDPITGTWKVKRKKT